MSLGKFLLRPSSSQTTCSFNMPNHKSFSKDFIFHQDFSTSKLPNITISVNKEPLRNKLFNVLVDFFSFLV